MFRRHLLSVDCGLSDAWRYQCVCWWRALTLQIYVCDALVTNVGMSSGFWQVVGWLQVCHTALSLWCWLFCPCKNNHNMLLALCRWTHLAINTPQVNNWENKEENSCEFWTLPREQHLQECICLHKHHCSSFYVR